MRRKPSQAELVKTLSDRELILNLYVTQLILTAVAMAAVFLWFDNKDQLGNYFQWNPAQILLYGGLTGFGVVVIDLLLMKWLPEALYDDGGINERVFSSLSVPHIFVVTALIALVEEILFRGVIQSSFGIVIASLVFTVIHVRYLRKKLLIVVTLGLSFLLGLLFFYTQNLFTCIFAHFIIDFVLGIYIRLRYTDSECTEESGE